MSDRQSAARWRVRATMSCSPLETRTRSARRGERRCEAAASPAAAVTAADVVILAVPWGAVDAVTNEIRDASDDTVVVDVTNPLTSDYSALATSGGPSAAETVAQRLPRAHVVKALNTLFGSVQADPNALGRRSTRSTPRTTRSPGTIAELLSSIGFRPVNVGGLAAARELEALAFLNIRLQMLTGGDWRSAFVLRARRRRPPRLQP